jgi:glycosyltransferase involved in cell wall biosynthesis
MSLPISGLVITYNEEVNIGECLDSLCFLDEVFVIDSFSTDRTVEICKRYESAGVKIFRHKFEDYARQRNWALKNLPWSNEWIFVLDADERISLELRAELEGVFASDQSDADFYYVKRRFIFLGRWLKHSTFYPFWLLRLFRRSEARYVRSVNEQVLVSGKPGYLKHDLIHKDQKGLFAWIEKHNRYSSLEAKEYLAVKGGRDACSEHRKEQRGTLRDVRIQGLKRLFISLPFRPFIRFSYMYFWRRGFLDGKEGLTYCMLQAVQEFHINCKMCEMKLEGKTNVRNLRSRRK